MLKKYQAQGLTVADISKLLERNEGAIVSRKKKLGLSQIAINPPLYYNNDTCMTQNHVGYHYFNDKRSNNSKNYMQ